MVSIAPAAVVSDTAMEDAHDPRIERRGDIAIVQGDWTLLATYPRANALARELDNALKVCAHWDLRALLSLDEFGALLLWRAWGWRMPVTVSLRPEHEARFRGQPSAPSPAPERTRETPVQFLDQVGRAAIAFGDHLVGFLRIVGDLVLALATLPRHAHLVPWREISANIYRSGALAVPITGMVGVLIGVVLSYLFALQLRAYGADEFIVRILGIGVLRELGPMLAAILVAGRSGASIAAQIGVMRVTQELDALAVMGISSTLRLVLPKVIALMIAMPALVLWTDVTALFGGMLAAQQELNISASAFISSIPANVPIANLWLGLAKGAVFGAAVALVSCHFGLRIQPNSESLGEGTTQAVVAAITFVLLIDACFAIAFSDVGFK